MKNLERVKKIIIEYYGVFSENNKFEEPAANIEEPFLKEFSRDFDLCLQKNKDNKHFKSETENNLIEDLGILEELDEQEEGKPVDIIQLTNIETKVVKILQYLNLEFYNRKKIKEVITQSMLDSIRKDNLTHAMEDKIKDVIVNLVDHEFRQLSQKKKERRKTLIKDILEEAEPFLNEKLEYHHKTRISSVNKLQESIFKKYITEECHNHILLKLKAEEKINFDEYLFLKEILKKYVWKKYSDFTEASTT